MLPLLLFLFSIIHLAGRSVDTLIEVNNATQQTFRCYSVCLKQQPQDANLWYDLGLNLCHQVKVQSKDVGSSMAKSSSLNSQARKAFQCLQRAVTLAPSDPTFWNALGVVSASKPLCNYALAQHCFIKSIGCHGNNAMAWSNLGFVYLVNKEAVLAHKAFKNAQSIEPLFVSSWIGQVECCCYILSYHYHYHYHYHRYCTYYYY